MSGPPASGLTSTEAPARNEPGVFARRREDAGNRPANAERSEAMALSRALRVVLGVGGGIAAYKACEVLDS